MSILKLSFSNWTMLNSFRAIMYMNRKINLDMTYVMRMRAVLWIFRMCLPGLSKRITSHNKKTGEYILSYYFNILPEMRTYEPLFVRTSNSCGIYVLRCFQYWNGEKWTSHFSQVWLFSNAYIQLNSLCNTIWIVLIWSSNRGQLINRGT